MGRKLLAAVLASSLVSAGCAAKRFRMSYGITENYKDPFLSRIESKEGTDYNYKQPIPIAIAVQYNPSGITFRNLFFPGKGVYARMEIGERTFHAIDMLKEGEDCTFDRIYDGDRRIQDNSEEFLSVQTEANHRMNSVAPILAASRGCKNNFSRLVQRVK